jgi:hypothetical protein
MIQTNQASTLHGCRIKYASGRTRCCENDVLPVLADIPDWAARKRTHQTSKLEIRSSSQRTSRPACNMYAAIRPSGLRTQKMSHKKCQHECGQEAQVNETEKGTQGRLAYSVTMMARCDALLQIASRSNSCRRVGKFGPASTGLRWYSCREIRRKYRINSRC